MPSHQKHNRTNTGQRLIGQSKIRIYVYVTAEQLDYLEQIHPTIGKAARELVQYCIKHVPVEDVIFEGRQ